MQKSYLEMSDRGQNSVAKCFFAIMIIFGMWQFVGAQPYLLLVVCTLIDNNPVTTINQTTGRLIGVDPLLDYISLNLTMIYFLIGIYMAIKLIHKRSIKTLITPLEKINWRNIFIGFVGYGILVLLGTVADYIAAPETYKISFDASKFFIGLPIILILTPLQTTAEELFFRGYILQNFGRKIKNTLILSSISGFIFMVPHLANPEVFKSTSMGIFESFSGIIYYFIVGFILSVVTIKTNSLEVAIGAHAANNLIGALAVGYKDSVFQTNTLFYTTRFEPVFNLVVIIVTSIVFYFIVAKTIKPQQPDVHNERILEGT